VAEGGLYIGGLSFVSSSTVLPRMLERLGASSVLIALSPTLLTLGFILPGLFVAHRIEQLPKMRGWVVGLGVWQRLPYLGAALLLWAAAQHPSWAMPTVLATPFVSGCIGGVAVNAWKEYVASTIPERLRASMWALRFIVGTMIGFLVGGVVTRVLSEVPGPRGYALLHGGTFACLTASFFIFLWTNERPHGPRPARQTLGELLRGVPALVRSDRRFALYLWARIPLHGVYVIVPFLGVHALEVLGKPDAYLGTLLASNMLGSLVGYLLAGYSGDRHGGRLSLLAAHFAFLGVAVGTPFTASAFGFQALFCLLGAGLSMSAVALSTLDLEITPLERRVSFQAVLGVFTLLGLLTASLLAATVRHFTTDVRLLCAPAAALMLASLALFLVIEEPRRAA
jgi:MFS family permease